MILVQLSYPVWPVQSVRLPDRGGVFRGVPATLRPSLSVIENSMCTCTEHPFLNTRKSFMAEDLRYIYTFKNII